MTVDKEPLCGGPLKEQLVKRFIELADEVSLQLHPTLLQAWSEAGLTMQQLRALSILSYAPLRISDIAARLAIRLPAATNLVDRLETKRLLRRTPDLEDRRVVWCQLTALGSKEAANLWQINRRLLENVAGKLTNEELNKAVRAFETLTSAFLRSSHPNACNDAL